MPLKRKSVKAKEGKVDAGDALQAEKRMSLFEKAKLPLITLNSEQFHFPETFLIMEAKRIELPKINPETGWALKNASGEKVHSGNYGLQCKVVDGDAAQGLVDLGQSIAGLSTLTLTIEKDVPMQEIEPESTLVKPKKLVVMLGFGGQNVDRIVLKCKDVELV